MGSLRSKTVVEDTKKCIIDGQPGLVHRCYSQSGYEKRLRPSQNRRLLFTYVNSTTALLQFLNGTVQHLSALSFLHPETAQTPLSA